MAIVLAVSLNCAILYFGLKNIFSESRRLPTPEPPSRPGLQITPPPDYLPPPVPGIGGG